MHHLGTARLALADDRRARARLTVLVCVAVVVTVLVGYVASRALGGGPPRCERFAEASAARAEVVTGSGPDVVVIGDSYAAGLGLARSAASWPVHLPGRVHVAGFSGSGFSAGASTCADVSFADRVPAALANVAGDVELVVVEGGLNDHDQPSSEIRAGFRRLMSAVDGHRVVVVGPVTAPARAAGVPRVDRLLAELAGRHGAAYVRTSDLDLPYLRDGLHLTPSGHEAFGAAVAARIAALG